MFGKDKPSAEEIKEMRKVPRAVRAAAFEHAREKDRRGDNGITNRTDMMLDEMLAEQDESGGK